MIFTHISHIILINNYASMRCSLEEDSQLSLYLRNNSYMMTTEIHHLMIVEISIWN